MTPLTTPPAPTLRWRRWAAAVAVAAVVLGVAAMLWSGRAAQVRLAGVDPSGGAVLTAPPAEVGLVFSGVPRPLQMHLAVTGPDGVAVAGGEPAVDGRRIVVPVTAARAGAYTVAYHVRLADGWETTGRSGFTVTSDTAGAVPDGGAPVAEPEGHVHIQRDGLSLALICLDLLLVVATLVLMLPGRRRR